MVNPEDHLGESVAEAPSVLPFLNRLVLEHCAFDYRELDQAKQGSTLQRLLLFLETRYKSGRPLRMLELNCRRIAPAVKQALRERIGRLLADCNDFIIRRSL